MAIVSPDPYGDPEIPYCGDCGHFHIVDVSCPERDRSCDSFLCCNGMDD